jgi:hypothetical protein
MTTSHHFRPRANPFLTLSIAASIALTAAACDGTSTDESAADTETGDGDTETGDGDASVDDDEVLAAIADYPSSFVQINAEPLTSVHMGGSVMVNIWVDPANAEQYMTIDPDNPAALELAVGAIVIKEHLDDQMNVAGGTIMVKGPAGYDANGDWWYGMGDLQGSLAVSGPALADCLACHSALAQTDFLHGVAPEDQAN